MEILSLSRNVRMSAQKVREVTRQIQGLRAVDAQAVLGVVPRKSASLVAKTLKSALANAENNNGLKPETLWIKEATAGSGTTIRRFTPKARGSAGPILKRSCNIKIVLSDSTAYGTKD
jgi:large subunit ribosomal protein L22